MPFSGVLNSDITITSLCWRVKETDASMTHSFIEQFKVISRAILPCRCKVVLKLNQISQQQFAKIKKNLINLNVWRIDGLLCKNIRVLVWRTNELVGTNCEPLSAGETSLAAMSCTLSAPRTLCSGLPVCVCGLLFAFIPYNENN